VRQNIFTLSKREQRAAIAIILALLLATFALHYRSLRSPIAPPAKTPAATPLEEQTDSDDSR
jgi:hypothetical protein